MNMLEKIENPVPYQTIKDIVTWIEEDLTRAMPVIKIAEKSGYSPWYLQRLFKKVTGYTLVGYIRARRMTVAAELLRSSTLSISDIYLHVGFDDHSSFCRNFMRHFGVTPSTCRSKPEKISSKVIIPPDL